MDISSFSVEELIEETAASEGGDADSAHNESEAHIVDENTLFDEQPKEASALIEPTAENGGNEQTTESDTVAVPAEIPEKKMVSVKRVISVEKYGLIMGIDQLSPEMYDLVSVIFIRSSDGEVPSFGPAAYLNDHFEFSMLNYDVLYSIANVLNQIYIPVLQHGGGYVADGQSDVDESLRHELSSNMVKFEHQLRHVVNQTRGDIRLTIPSVNIADMSSEAVADDFEIISQIESALYRSIVSTNSNGLKDRKF